MGDEFQFSWNVLSLEEAKLLPKETVIAGSSLDEQEVENIQFDFDKSVSKADRMDCMAAASIGALSGILNVFWQKNFDLESAREWGSEKIGSFVVEAAKTQGFKPKSVDESNTLRDAIRFLEKEFPLAADKATAAFGGGLQHHLRDFEHHPTPLGLLFSILTQFTGKAYGTDTNGDFFVIVLPVDAPRGRNFQEKIAFGTIRWFFHLVSDMAGSSSTPGAGTGIPGPLLAMFKELSTTPFFKNIQVDYKGSDIAFSKYISKLFNGTAIRNEAGETIRFDLRTEVGLYNQAISQTKSIAANECLVCGYYFMTRLLREIKYKEISSIAELSKIEPSNVLPFNSRALKRMLAISSTVFVAVNVGNAAVKAAIESKGKKGAFAQGVLIRLNYFGIACMAIAIYNDAPYIAEDLKDLIEERFGDYVCFTEDFGLLELNARTARVLYSIEALAVENDIALTKSEIQRKEKRTWASAWRAKIAKEMGTSGQGYFLTEENTYSELRDLGSAEATTSLEALLVLELAQFAPYTPLNPTRNRERKKALKYGSDYMTKILPSKQEVLTGQEIKSITSARNRYERKLTGSTVKLVAGGIAIAGVTAATAGAAYVFAPVIAPLLAGNAVAGLSGAALTSASLAAIGGGSLAAGGLGMAGGTAILAGGGALLGLAGSGTVAMAINVGELPERFFLNECCKLLVFTEACTRETGNPDFARKAAAQLERLHQAVEDEIAEERAKGKDADKKGIENRKMICGYLEKSITLIEGVASTATASSISII